MSSRKRIIISIICAALSVALVASYATSVRGQASAAREDALRRYGGETVKVCVTTRTVERGEEFSERNVDTKDWLVDLLPEGALQQTGQVLGKAAASRISSNTPICDVDVDAQTQTLDVPEGMSAISVPCTPQSAVGGSLAPGSDVDVYLVDSGSARLLCPRVRVLQVSPSSSNSWVTIAVDPDRVEALIAASSLQNLYFVLPSEDQLATGADLKQWGLSAPQDEAASSAESADASVSAEAPSESSAPSAETEVDAQAVSEQVQQAPEEGALQDADAGAPEESLVQPQTATEGSTGA
jgi:pilus assembly protein CpaB